MVGGMAPGNMAAMTGGMVGYGSVGPMSGMAPQIPPSQDVFGSQVMPAAYQHQQGAALGMPGLLCVCVCVWIHFHGSRLPCVFARWKALGSYCSGMFLAFKRPCS